MYAASSRASITGRRNCIKRLLAEWGEAPYPATAEKLRHLGAGLHAGSFRSAATILSQYKVDGERRGECFTPEMARLIADVGRACRRGQGPPVRAAPLPLERLGELPGGADPWVPGGPVGPRNAIVVGAWWLLREVEAANLRAALVTIAATTVPTATLSLPASKSDAAARGVTRSQACLCTGAPRADCPVHSAWDQQLILQRLFSQRFVGGRPAMDLPLFPSSAGAAVTKQAFTATILHAASLLNVPLSNREGTLRVSGHSLRPTGAQGLARLGLDVWAIQLLGRWGSGSVMEYVRESAASPEAAISRRNLLGQSLHDLVGARRRGASAGELARLALAEVRAELPAFLSDLRRTLLEELRPAAARAPDAGRSSSSSSSSSSGEASLAGSISDDVPVEVAGAAAVPPEEHVSSSWTARRHRITVGPAVLCTPADWQTACGWKFGCSGGSREPRPADTDCLRCFPGGV